MKFSLLFLSCCLVATTLGQNLFYWPHFAGAGQQHHPISRSGAQYWPRYRRPVVSYGNQYEQFTDDDYSDGEFDAGQEDEVFGRNKFRLRGSSVNKLSFPKSSIDNARIVDNRATFTSTSIEVSTTFRTTTTVTQTSVATCIAKAQFAGAAAALSTTACRRKRDIPLILEPINPTSNIEQIETTVQVPDAVVDRFEREIESSQQQNDPVQSRFALLSNLLMANNPFFSTKAVTLTATATTTITIPTSFVFTTVTSSRTLAAGLAAAAQLSCLPAGFSVC